MLRIFSVLIATFVGMFLTVSSALASDVALVIGNRTYQHASWIYGAQDALDAAARLRREGYSVISGRDLSAVQTRPALDGFVARLDQADRAVIVLSGHFVHSGANSWFVPVDVRRPNLATISYEGLSLNALYQLLASKPGGAAIFLGTASRNIDLGFGLQPGIGPMDIPQGVFVATGNPTDIARTVPQDFLEPGVGFAAALANAPSSVSGQGFVSDMGMLLPVQGGADANYDEARREEGFWQAVVNMNTHAAMQAYLRAYPNGVHAPDAQDWLAARVEKTPAEKARDAEAALALSRAERRAVQENLSLLGYDTHGIDGIFGRGTRSAIANWQGDHGFDGTGFLQTPQIARIDRQATRRAAQLAAQAEQKRRELEAADRAYWQSSGAASGDERGLHRYLNRYPDGLFADIAQLQLDTIARAKQKNLNTAERTAWDAAKTDDTIPSYQDYLNAYPNGSFADEASARIVKLKKEAQKKAEIDAAKQAEADLQLNKLARILIEQKLQLLNLKPGSPDGQFDKKTRRAIRKFQKTRGFPVTGYLTRQVVVRLIAEAG